MKFVDSSVWLSHIAGTRKDASQLVESNIELFSSVLTLFEVKRRLLNLKINKGFIETALDFIKIRSIIVNINEDIVNKAVDLSVKNRLHAVDSMIYASALSLDVKLVTADNDFRNLDNVEIIDK